MYPASKWVKRLAHLSLSGELNDSNIFYRYAATAITECVRQELQYLNEYIKITVSRRFIALFRVACHKNKPSSSLFWWHQHIKAISPGLVDSDTNTANDELLSLMPSLSPKDVSAAVVYAISVKENVQVSAYGDRKLEICETNI